jgi:hypothetical protein
VVSELPTELEKLPLIHLVAAEEAFMQTMSAWGEASVPVLQQRTNATGCWSQMI